MGAERFDVGSRVSGSAEEAFKQVREDALYDFGHRGYTGTIAEKDGYFVYTPPAGVDHVELLNAFEESYYGLPSWADDDFIRAAKLYNDKWGPAVAIKRPDGWDFIGWASS